MGAKPSFPLVTLPSGSVAIVTGSNTGIGYEAAKYLAIMGATVILACRSEEKARDAMERMKREVAEMRSSNKLPGFHVPQDISVEFMKLDLSSLTSTIEFARAFKSSGRKLHLLLCNAAYIPAKLEITGDGYEINFQVNYLGHFLLIAHLLPIMKRSGDDCRIVSTSSAAHKFAKDFDLGTATRREPNTYDPVMNYSTSKLYQVQHMFSLSQCLKNSSVSVTCMHPGFTNTEIFRNSGGTFMGFLISAAKALGFIRTPYQGAVTLIDAAVNPKWKGQSNIYFVDCKTSEVSGEAKKQGIPNCFVELQHGMPQRLHPRRHSLTVAVASRNTYSDTMTLF